MFTQTFQLNPVKNRAKKYTVKVAFILASTVVQNKDSTCNKYAVLNIFKSETHVST